MNRRNFFAALLAPIMARWFPKPEPLPLGPIYTPGGADVILGWDAASQESVTIIETFYWGSGSYSKTVATLDGSILPYEEFPRLPSFVFIPEPYPWESKANDLPLA